jgi:glutamate synthase (NADPH/NADH) small chain
MDCDQVIDAIGTEANPLVRAEGMEKNDRGYIIVDEESKATTRKGIFAGGDIARGSATVILAIGDAKKAARAVDAFLSGQ